jgi:hypothetical protein
MTDDEKIALASGLLATYRDVWGSELVREQFLDQPEAVLRSHGVDVPDGIVEPHIDIPPGLDTGKHKDFFKLWEWCIRKNRKIAIWMPCQIPTPGRPKPFYTTGLVLPMPFSLAVGPAPPQIGGSTKSASAAKKPRARRRAASASG